MSLIGCASLNSRDVWLWLNKIGAQQSSELEPPPIPPIPIPRPPPVPIPPPFPPLPIPPLPIPEMSYGESYGERVQIVEGAQWWSTRQIGLALRTMGGINFSVVGQRAQALEIWNGINDEAPFHQTKRFPEVGTYVCSYRGDWPAKVTQMVEALNFKETTDNPGKSKPNGNGKPEENVGFGDWNYNLAERSYFKAIEQIKAQLGRNDSVFGRRSFEADYALVWA